MFISDVSIQRLQHYLSPELRLRLAHDGTLPPALLAQVCLRLRRELSMVASFVPHPLVHGQLARTTTGQITGAFWYGSMLVAQVDGLAAFVDQLSASGQEGAEEVDYCVRHLFGALVDEVHHYSGGLFGGGMLAFRGNTVTAFFDAAVLENRHAIHAVNAALAMQTRFVAYHSFQTRKETFPLELRIGVHSGRFFVAEVGDAQHIELIVTGQQMQHAVHALALAEHGQIVVSEETRALLDDAGSEMCRPGFYLLQYVPKLPPPPTPQNWGWESGTSTLDDLRHLVARIESLHPYLPHGLSREWLAARVAERSGGGVRSVSVLCLHYYPLSLLLDQCSDDPIVAVRMLNAFYRRVQATIQRYGGRVSQAGLYAPGDTVTALFGDPEAQEDAPLRAVHAALDLREAIHAANEEISDLIGNRAQAAGDDRAMPYPWSLRAALPVQGLSQRIGISTGVIFTGLVGGRLRRAHMAIGPAIHMASHLAAAAEDDEIVLAPTTRRLVGQAVVAHERLPVRVPGVAELLVPAGVEGMYTPETPRLSTPMLRARMVGRDQELRVLLERAATAGQGRGQVVALVGDAGIGKTRLIEEVLQRLATVSAEPDPVRSAFRICHVKCQSYDQSTPYAIMRELLRQLLHPGPDADTAHLYQVAQQYLQQACAPEVYRCLPVLGDLLNLPVAETEVTAALTSEQRHARAYDLVAALLQALTREGPLFLAVDDLHWADASSFELLAKLAAGVPELPLLLVLSYRPGGLHVEPWRETDPDNAILLQEISPVQKMQLVAGLIGSLPPPDLLAVLQQAQGNPFFIEELLYNLLEQGILQPDVGGWCLHTSPDTVKLPYKIESVVRARLERLAGDERELLQIAAVIGRHFSYDLLAGIVSSQAHLDRRLAILEQSGFVRSEGTRYVFRHTLLRDIIYTSMSFARRRALHRRVAARLAELSDSRLELLARHTLLAEEWSATFRYHLEAGRQAQARHASHEALALYETALAVVPQLDAPPNDQLILLHERLGTMYSLFGQHKAALASYNQALNLCKREYSTATVEDQMRLRRLIAGVHERCADYATAFKWLDSALAAAGERPGLELARCLLLGAGIQERQGRYGQALEWAQRARDVAVELDSVHDQAHAAYLLAGIYGNLGNNRHAVELARQSLQLYHQTGDLQGEARARINLGNFLHELGAWSEARTHFEVAAHLTASVGNIHEQAMVANNLGDVLRGLGDFDSAIVQYQAAQRGWQHSLYGNGVVAMNLGAAYLRRGDLDLAAQQFALSRDFFQQAGAEGFLPELLRYGAELALARHDFAEAGSACAASLDYARRLGARLEEGATRRVLGRVLTAQGDLEAADAALSESLELLRAADSRYEEACTLLAIADLAPLRQRFPQGKSALERAVTIFETLGAHYDLEQAYLVAQRWGYGVEDS